MKQSAAEVIGSIGVGAAILVIAAITMVLFALVRVALWPFSLIALVARQLRSRRVSAARHGGP